VPPLTFQSLIARLRTVTSALTTLQMVTLGLVFVAVVGLVVGSAYWLNTTPYSVLFSDMDPEAANGIVTRLKNDKVPYTIDEGGRTIRVPTARLDEVRLQVAGQGMPASGRIGFEIFDRTNFGQTDFLEHVNYRRALEGELARTIGTIAEVANARVHIAMGRPSLFAGQDQAATASVVLKLKNTRPLAPSTITAISALVASGVEGLRPEGVTIMDSFGRPLTRTSDSRDEVTGGLAAERQQRIERDLSTRVVSLLEPIVGASRVRVNVSAKLNIDSQEETEERWDPNPVMRSHQSVVQNGPVLGSAQGVAGVRSNTPPPQPSTPQGTPAQPPVAPPAAAPVQATHTSEMTNYEVGKLTRHRIQPQGQIARLSVAVLLDDDHMGVAKGAKGKPRAAKELEQIHDVVAAAVGFDMERGDQLTVENIAFEEQVVDEPAPQPWYRRSTPEVLETGRIVAVLLIGLLVVFGVIRPTVRRALGPVIIEPPPALAAAPDEPRTVADVEGALDSYIEDEGEIPAGGVRRLPALTRQMAKLAKQEPENAARLVRTWLTEEAR
jgi:flagellar M-ring protein FliF